MALQDTISKGERPEEGLSSETAAKAASGWDAPSIEGLCLAGFPRAEPEKSNLGERPTLAVLPFANLSGDQNQAYLADGLSEDIIAELGRFTSLTVIGKSSSFHFRGGMADAKTVGGSLARNIWLMAACGE